MSETELKKELQKVQTHDLRPGDLVVISVPFVISMEAAERIKDMTSRLLPDQKVLLLSEGMTLEIYRDMGKQE